MVFERKKIQTETLGEYLFAIRQNLNISPEEVLNKTGMSPKFLQSLESGNFKNLPADVYIIGFLRQLAKLYSIDPDDLIEQYKKEKIIERQIVKQDSLLNSSLGRRVFKKLVITPKFLTIASGALFVLVTIGYIIWQVWSINKTPKLEVYEPQDNQIILGASVEVRGQSDPGMSVTVNGQNIFVDSDGNFHTELGISTGPTQFVLTATNRFGKSVSKTVNVVGSIREPAQNQLTIRLDFSATVTLGYTIDNDQKKQMSFVAGDSKTFSAKQKITLDTSDAGATKVILNGEVIGVMGKTGENLTGVSFYSQSADK